MNPRPLLLFLRAISILIPLFQLMACATPAEYLYTIETSPGKLGHQLIHERPTVLVGPVTLPELIDHPQLVLRNGYYIIDVNERHRWATPLKESLPRVIAAELSQLNTKQNYIAASPSVSPSAKARLLIEITNFDISPTGASIIAYWAYRPIDTHIKAIEGVSSVHAPTKSSNYIEYVDSARRATIKLANDIADNLSK